MLTQDSKIRRPNLILIRSLFVITLFYCLRSKRVAFANAAEESFCEKRLKEYYEDRREYREQCRYNPGGQSSSCCKLIKESLKDRVRQYRILCPNSAILEPDQDGQCDKETDIIFVLDRSGSINNSDFEIIRALLHYISNILEIGVINKQGKIISQGAIVTFSEEGTTRITLEESRTHGKFDYIVYRMPGPLKGGRTKIHLGLAAADKDVALNKYGLRDDDPEVKKVLMVITDGEQTKGGADYVYVGDAIKPFFKRDMDVLAIGIGVTEVARKQINDMVKVKENAFFPKNYTELSEVVNYFMKNFCPANLLKPEFTTFPPSNVKIREGEDKAYWEYEVVGSPLPQIWWYIVRNDNTEELLANCGESGVCDILISDYLNLYIDRVVFTIKQPSFPKDDVKFKCVATSLLGVATKEFRVTVEVCECPRNGSSEVVTSVNSKDSKANVSWTVPESTCSKTTLISVSPDVSPGHLFSVGSYTVDYVYSVVPISSDQANFNITCRVNIEVKPYKYMYTCGGKDYNPLDKVCCQGQLQYRMESTGKCCGKNYYNDSYIASKDVTCP